MAKSAFLAPVPYMHLEGAIEILQEKPFALFGTEVFDFFVDVELGARILIYRSHEEAEPLISHQGIYQGYVSDPFEMKKLEREGYRPPTTIGEKWGMYWKCSDIKSLSQPMAFGEIQLASRKYLSGYPRRPIEIKALTGAAGR